MKIIVPATSANIGPGFDSVGVAVTKYLQIEVCEERDEWLIEHQIGKWIPHDERNLLLKIALQIVPDLQPRRLKMTSNVPLARGLGSSSSVIVAGIELADQLGKLNLSDYDKLQLATKIEVILTMWLQPFMEISLLQVPLKGKSLLSWQTSQSVIS